MKILKAELISKSIIELSQDKKIDKEKLQKEIFNIVLDVKDDYANEIIEDLNKLIK
jgi:glycerol-3-phosphate O-acyltransferase